MLIVGLLLASSPACQGVPPPAFTELSEARRLAADLSLQFSKATDASNRAVIADTDESSSASARDAQQKAQLVEKDVAALVPLLSSLHLAKETQLLAEFRGRFSAYRELDRSILELAVENTNLKAQRLSFGPAREAADSFRDALSGLVAKSSAKDRCRAETLVAKAVLAVREVQVRVAPHIAELDDAAMASMEKDMNDLGGNAAAALDELSRLIQPGTNPAFATAKSALERFKGITTQIVALSRRNSNVRSLDLSLRAKPALTAACDESLRAFQVALEKEGFRATR